MQSSGGNAAVEPAAQADVPLRPVMIADRHDALAEFTALSSLVGSEYDVAQWSELRLNLSAAALGKCDWLRGRHVVIWPTRDRFEILQDDAYELSALCLAATVRLLDVRPEGANRKPSTFIGEDWDAFVKWARPLLITIDYAQEQAKLALADLVQVNAGRPESPPDYPPWSGGEHTPGEPAPMPDSLPLEAYAGEATGPQDDVPHGTMHQPYLDSADVASGPQDWPEPLQLSAAIPKAMPFNPAWLPSPLDAFVADLAARGGVDAGMPGLSALAACAGVAPDSIKVMPQQNDTDWLERPCIWVLAVAPATYGKTHGLYGPMRYVEDMDRDHAVQTFRKLKDYEYEMEGYENQRRAALKDGKPRPLPPERPSLDQIYLNKFTLESLRVTLADSPRGVICFRDEFSGFISDMDRYSSKGTGSGDREDALELYNGGQKKVGRVNNAVVVPNWSAVLCGGVQPITIKKVAGDLQHDGMLQRMMICVAEPKHEGIDRAPDEQAVTAYKKTLQTLRHMDGGFVVRFSPAAFKIRQLFEKERTALLQHEMAPELASHIGKLEGMFPRLCLIWHLIGLASHGQHPGPNELITEDSADRVSDFLLVWQLSHIRQFWNEIMGGGPSAAFASRMFLYILAHRVERLLHNKHIVQPHYTEWHPMPIYERKAVINRLEGAGIIQIDHTAKRNHEGFPMAYKVNPAVHDGRFAQQAEQERIRRKRDAAKLQGLKT